MYVWTAASSTANFIHIYMFHYQGRNGYNMQHE